MVTSKQICLAHLVILVAFAPSCHPPQDSTKSGKYITYSPNRREAARVESQFQKQVYPLPLALMYLRKDGTYVFGFCNNQVAEAGHYRVERDSVYFYDRYNLAAKGSMNSRTMYLDTTSGTIYYTYARQSGLREGFSEAVITMRKGVRKGHYGFLRGEEMSYDSLLNYYVQMPVDYQQRWSDSILKVRDR